MKNYSIYILSSLLCCFVSCSKNEDDAIEPSALEAPVLNLPKDNALCVDNTVSFEWFSSTIDDESAISYQFQYATDIDFTSGQIQQSVAANALTVQLEKDKIYYWRVKALDTLGNESPYSATRQLQTEGTANTNNLPYAPDLIAPLLGAIISQNSVDLKWQSVDSNAGDTLSYDVFFGTENPPTQKVLFTDISTSLTVNIASKTSYFWYVIVHDGKGGSAKGQVWTFSRE
ncbi:MAG: hypothetical protein ACPHXR_06955 [Flavicella sp.]